MCGIAGFLDFSGEMNEGLLQRMVTSLDHRGPDDGGILLDRSNAFLSDLTFVPL